MRTSVEIVPTIIRLVLFLATFVFLWCNINPFNLSFAFVSMNGRKGFDIVIDSYGTHMRQPSETHLAA